MITAADVVMSLEAAKRAEQRATDARERLKQSFLAARQTREYAIALVNNLERLLELMASPPTEREISR